MLPDVARRADTPTIEIFVAVTFDNELLGGVTFIGDAKNYNSGGTATTNTDSVGIRLLAVKPEARRMGVGKALTKSLPSKGNRNWDFTGYFAYDKIYGNRLENV